MYSDNIDIEYTMKSSGEYTDQVLYVKEFYEKNGDVTLAFWSSQDKYGYSTKLCELVKNSIVTCYSPKKQESNQSKD